MNGKKLFRSLTALLLTLAMLLSAAPAALAVQPLAASPAKGTSPWTGWTTTGWTLNADETLTYAGTDFGAAYKVSCNTGLSTNRVELLLRQDSAALAGNSHFGLYITTTGGDVYYWKYAVGEGGYAAFIKNPDGAASYLNPAGLYPSVPIGAWTSFKMVYDDTSIVFSVGGTQLFTLDGDWASILDGATVAVLDYATPLSVKYGSLEPDINPWKDWSFSSAWAQNEAHELTYAGTDFGAAYKVSCNNGLSTNRVELLLRQDSAALAGNSHFGLYITTAGGDVYYWKYAVGEGGYAAFIKDPDGAASYLNPAGLYPSVPIDTWTSFKMVYDDASIVFSVGGTQLFTLDGDWASILDGATVAVLDYATPLSVKYGSLEPEVNPWKDWVYSAVWTKNEENVLSYAGTDLGAGYQVTYNKGLDTNCVVFSLRRDGNAAAGNGHMGVWFTLPNGDAYYFMVASADGYSCVKRFPAAGGEEYINPTGGVYPSVPIGSWVDFKVIYDENSADFYIGDTLNHSVPGNFAQLFDGAKVSANSYATPLSVVCKSLAPVTIEKWTGWEKSADGGYSYNGTDLGAAHFLRYKGTTTTNRVEIDLRVDGEACADNGHLGIRLEAKNGDAYYFMASPVYGYASVIRYPAGGGEEYLNTGSAYYTLSAGQWATFKVIVTDEYIGYYINGVLMHLLYGEFAGVFDDCKPCVADYGIPASAKIVGIDSVELESGSSFPEDWGYNANWTLQPEGYVSYNGGEMISSVSCAYPITTDCITYAVRVDEPPTADDANLGLILNCADGTQYFFQYNSFVGYGGQAVWVNETLAEKPVRWITAQKPAYLSDGEWHTVKAMFRSDLVAIFLDDELVCYHFGDYGDKFKNATCRIQSYGTKMSLKVESMEQSERNVFDYDFEFNSPEAVADFSAQNGVLSHENSSLIFTLNGADASFTTPVLPNAVGTRYSALVSVHNTVLLRLKNNTAAEAVRVTIKTDSGTAALDVPVAAYSDYGSYFVNFSRFKLEGYIRTVRIAAVGAAEGTLELEAMTFEKEMPDDETAGKILSCVADFETDTVTVTGELKPDYAGQSVTLYETTLRNLMSTVEGDVLGTVKADGTSFTIEFPLYNGNMSRLPSYFLAAVGQTRVADRFLIDNGADIEENPYAFTLPDYTVTVTDAPYNAKGDAFTDDTAAIQAAIDEVAAQGGGTVIVPGEPENFYGRRYMITNVHMASNVELRIEKGAVLWQSPRAEQYNYTPAYGHNAFLEVQIPWCAAAFVTNWPLVNAYECENSRITGGGEIRGADHGGESWDGTTGENRDLNCDSLIHCMLVGSYACRNMEISDLILSRSGGYFCPMINCEQMFCSNLQMKMPVCTEADIISPCNSKDVFINYVHGYSNDDSVVLASSVEDPRGQVAEWWHSDGTKDNDCRNITVCHSSFVGGKGLTFIAWGNNRDDLSQQEIRDIHAYDTHFNTLATWYDNPYHGTPYFTSLEEDYSSVRGVRIENCWFDKTPSFRPIPATDVVTDIEGLHSATQFEYGDFERNDPDHADWIVNLCNWTVEETGGTVEELSYNDSRAAKLTGTASLAQGLYMSQYHKSFTAEVTVEQGSARLFVRDILTGEELAVKELPAGTSGACELAFVGTDRNVYIGVQGCSENAVVYIDSARIEHAAEETAADTAHPGKEIYIIDQTKPLVTLKNSDAGTVFYRNETAGSPKILLPVPLTNGWELSFTVQPKTEENLLRTYLQNSDYGKQILMDFHYNEDRQIGISYQFKLSKTTWTENTSVWVDLPEDSRSYSVRLTHADGADTLLLEVTDIQGTVVFSEALAHPNYTNARFYGAQYGLNFQTFDWSPSCELRGLYCGGIGENTNPAETYTVRWNVDGTFTEEEYLLGQTPSFKGDTAKADDAQWRYTFAGWDKALATVDENVTYAACYTKRILPSLCTHEYERVEASCVEPTCTENGKMVYFCPLCEDTKEESVEALGHDMVTDAAVAATCTATGLTEGSHCSRCDYKVAQNVVEKLPHTEAVDAAVAATCTEAGKTEGKHCSVCNEVLVAQTVTEALGHDWGEGVVITEPTLTEKGVRTYTCSRCDATRTEEIPEIELPFTDVPMDKWYTDAVAYAYVHELMSGTSATTFNPEGSMTRAMLVTVLWRLNGETPAKTTNSFTDVPSGQWYSEAVSWAAENKLVSGTGNGSFNPTGNVTREQIAVFMFNYARFKGYSTDKTADLTAFPDSGRVSNWAKAALSWANAEGLISGTSVNGVTYLSPQGNATRSQVAAIIMRYVQNIVG